MESALNSLVRFVPHAPQNSLVVVSSKTLWMLAKCSTINSPGPVPRSLKVRKYAQQNRATCRATLLHLLRCKLQSDVAHISTKESKSTFYFLQQTFSTCNNFFCCVTSCDEGGNTSNITLQLATQQCCATSCTILLLVFAHLYG